MKYTVIGDEAILELTRDDLRALLAKLDDDADCTMVTHDDNAVWKVIDIVAVEDDKPVEAYRFPAIIDVPDLVDRGE